MEQKNKKISESWWKEAVVYQIYPRSFQDSNDDGIGDLPGITSRMPYLRSLGVNVLWLSPIFRSPNEDNGYDISDYYDIMPEFGTMQDFDHLLLEVHRHGMKLILDLVVNHTSDQHPWFIQGSSSRENPYYDYYHWWPAEQGEPPFRASYFDVEGNGWKYNEPTDSYYLHYFSDKQPDLNWNNPKLRQSIYEIIRFWFDKGVDGFRMDSISLIGKEPGFPEIDLSSNPYVFDHYALCPLIHEHLQEMNREVLCRYDVLTVGEGSAVKKENACDFVHPERNELQMLYHFGPSEVRNFTGPDGPDTGIPYSLVSLKKMFTDWNHAFGDGWPTVYLGNHDQPRMVSRFGDDSPLYRTLSAKMLTLFLLTMRGTPYWYAGDELGMRNIRFSHIEDYNDIATRNEYERLKKTGGDLKAFLEREKETGRDNARTPFQWNMSRHAGFSHAKPWLKVNPDYRNINAEAQENDPESVLNFFRNLINMRKLSKTLLYGDYKLLDAENTQVYAYLRRHKQERLLVVLNFSPKEAVTVLNDFDFNRAHLLLGTYPDLDNHELDHHLRLRPYEGLLIRL